MGAFGGSVGRNSVKEIGWGEVRVADNALAVDWFGGVEPFLSFHWHGETFTIPPGGTRIAASNHCANQGFVLGKHLGLQCHVEMTPEMIESWIGSGAREVQENLSSPAVQPVATIRQQAPRYLPELGHAADRLYRRWVRGLQS